MALLYLKYMEKNFPLIIKIILSCIAYSIWFTVFITLMPFFIVIVSLKLFEKFFITVFKFGSLMESQDYPFTLETESNPNIIASCIRIKGCLSIDRLKEAVVERVLKLDKQEETFKRLKQFYENGVFTYKWMETTNFNVDNHVNFINKEYITKKSNDEQLKEITTKLSAESFPKEMSPWKLSILYVKSNLTLTTDLGTLNKSKNAESENIVETILFLCCHHCLGDGFSLLSLFGVLTDEKPVLIKVNENSGVAPNILKRVIHGIVSGPLTMLLIVLSTFGLTGHGKFMSKWKQPHRRIYWTKDIDLNRIKSLKKTSGTTINEIIMSILAGALRKLIINEPMSQEEKITKINDLPIIISFNSRKSNDRLRFPAPLTNRSGGTFFLLPLSIENHTERLQLTKIRSNILKSNSDAHLLTFLHGQLLALLPEMIAKFSLACLNRHSNLLLSNVPGPIEPLYVCGHEIASIRVVPPLVSNIGMSVSVLSYNGTVAFSFLTNNGCSFNGELLEQTILNEISDMELYFKIQHDKKHD